MRCSMIVLGLFVCGCQSGIYLTDDEGGPPRPAASSTTTPTTSACPTRSAPASGSRRTRPRATSPAGASSATRPTSSPSTPVKLDNGTLTATGHATGEGSARVRIVDAGGVEHHVTPVEVRAADSARFFSHGDSARARRRRRHRLRAGRGRRRARARRRQGGRSPSATSTPPSASMAAALPRWRPRPTSPSTTRRRRRCPSTTGCSSTPRSRELDARVTQNGVTLGTLPITAVADGDVTGLSIAAEANAKKSDKDATWLLTM